MRDPLAELRACAGNDDPATTRRWSHRRGPKPDVRRRSPVREPRPSTLPLFFLPLFLYFACPERALPNGGQLSEPRGVY
ncbi:hypothetical protein MRX96_003798 [Rhipicephalus microplus]